LIDSICSDVILGKIRRKNIYSKEIEQILNKGSQCAGPTVFEYKREDGNTVLHLYSKMGIKPEEGKSAGDLMTQLILRVLSSNNLKSNKIYSSTFANHAHIYTI